MAVWKPPPPRSPVGTALAVEADITDRTQAEAAVQQAVERFARLDTLVNNADLMLLGPVAGADVREWDGMIAVNACSIPPARPCRTCCRPQSRACACPATPAGPARVRRPAQ